ncbi:MAG: sigma-70 family RNA polymerase sigma factor [Chitinophagaceae bacterium]|nr:sigma-70 family RNA polymerase sigma factor [Chitinophagaceae bacterium]MCW5905758.1 sigma-70 family RNA polymerase sigma factor [Chitinophagaceae bacterium]
MNYQENDKAKLIPLKEHQDNTPAIYDKLSDLVIEKELLTLIKESSFGKTESQKKLYYVFYEYASNICLRYAANREDTLEIINDGFLKMFKKLDNFKPLHNNIVASFKTWLKKIMIFTAIDHYRKKIKQQNHDELNETISIASNDESQLERISYKEIISYIQNLSPAYRTVFCLFVIDGFTHEEIAKQLRISIGTSKSNLAKARVQLQRMIIDKQNLNNYEQRAV